MEIDRIFSERVEPIMGNLISLESHSQQDGCEAAVSRYLVQEFKSFGCSVQTREPAPGRPTIIASLGPDNGKPTIMFNAHTDTVPAPRWFNGNPYQIFMQDGRMYGRGTSDMKGPICACMLAFQALNIVAGDILCGRVIFTGVAGEEGSGSLGSYDVLMHGPVPDMVVVCEPTNLRIGVSQKGFVNFEIIFQGKAAHSGSPDEGVNALNVAARFLELHRIRFPEYFAHSRDALLGLSTLTPVVIGGGGRADTVPDECKVKLNCRYLPSIDLSLVENYIQAVARDACSLFDGSDFTVRTETKQVPWSYAESLLFTGSPFQTAMDSVIVECLSKSVQKVTGEPPNYFGAGFWSDAGLFGGLHGIPTVLCGPGRIEVAHGYAEYIEPAQILTAAKIYALMVLQLCA
jgi:acetylornithine deacetylase/succinyl-diaminopimelate desuccinylase